jgi:hypothetical protein
MLSSGKSTLALQIDHNLARQARCWRGQRATNNARLASGAMVRLPWCRNLWSCRL